MIAFSVAWLISLFRSKAHFAFLTARYCSTRTLKGEGCATHLHL
jgi:hypothetical protein